MKGRRPFPPGLPPILLGLLLAGCAADGSRPSSSRAEAAAQRARQAQPAARRQAPPRDNQPLPLPPAPPPDAGDAGPATAEPPPAPARPAPPPAAVGPPPDPPAAGATPAPEPVRPAYARLRSDGAVGCRHAATLRTLAALPPAQGSPPGGSDPGRAARLRELDCRSLPAILDWELVRREGDAVLLRLPGADGGGLALFFRAGDVVLPGS
ncbi:hypothetical protein LPC08_13520 [Roseomonas sp. OT10]|uniref:hypothetical protein n=1 Tax=Roseomonas cutis TaxID=2897332 RepID=UPI001E387186|nr:hypothetical protein [Roseomonas sp. OT10]UFN47046.1 hypothetical protein LPC08_13520 [Roseomonas sp. OT10]